MTRYQQQQIERAFARWEATARNLSVAGQILETAQQAEADARARLADAVFAAGVDMIDLGGHLVVRDKAIGSVLVVPTDPLQ